MRTTFTLACCLFALASCGEDTTEVDMASPDLSTPDLTPPRDLFMQDFAGVSCGATACDATTQECCVMTNGQTATQACVPKGSCDTDGGAALSCDGPEDCPSSQPPAGGCCATLGGNIGGDGGAGAGGGGSAMCVDKCPGQVTFDMDTGAFTFHTKLCHHKADCMGYTGQVPQLGSTKFDACCSSPQTGSYMFCAPGLAAGQMGITCTNQ